MDISNELKAIEVKATRNPEWYYHAFNPYGFQYEDMLTKGIKCRKLMKPRVKFSYPSHSGNHYISLSKMVTLDERYSSFIRYQDYPAFIIDGIETKKCDYSFDYRLLEKTRWPFRYSGFHDEYQAYRIISPQNFVGLRCSIIQWHSDNLKLYLKKLQEIIIFMQKHNINLPIYDYTRAFDCNIHQINPEAYLELHETIMESLEEEKNKQKVYIP